MKKLLLILTSFLLTIAVNAQGTQTEDEVYIGKGKIFGNYKGTGIIIPDFGLKGKPYNGPATLTGIVVKVDWCEEDCRTIMLKKDDGTTVTVGTRDYGFRVPKNIVGRKITLDGSMVAGGRKRRDQQDIQYAATGIKVID